MIEVQANPSIEHLKVIIGILIPVIILASAIIGFLLRYFINNLIKSNNKVADAVDNLSKALSELKMKLDIEIPVIFKRLDAHRRTLDRHEGSLSALITEHNIYHRAHVCGKPEKDEED